MAEDTICSDFGAPQNKVSTVSTVSPSISYEVMGPDAMILVFWILRFNPTFSLSCFTVLYMHVYFQWFKYFQSFDYKILKHGDALMLLYTLQDQNISLLLISNK